MTQTATTEPTARHLALAQGTAIVRGVDLVMEMLQSTYPRREFRRGPGGSLEAVLAAPWRRGGTSPGGSEFSGPVGGGGESPGLVARDTLGTYQIGWPDERSAGQPQRVLWTPPEPGGEEWGPPSAVGWVVGQGAGGEQVLRPASWADIAPDEAGQRPGRGWLSAGVGQPTGVGGSGGAGSAPGSLLAGAAPPAAGGPAAGLGGGQDRVQVHPNEEVRRRLAAAGVLGGVPGGNGRLSPPGVAQSFARTRLIPMTAHLWSADWDDAEQLMGALAGAAETVWQGTAGHMGQGVVRSSGWVRDEKGTNGIHGVLVVNFAVLVAYPAAPEARLASFGLGDGQVG